MDGKGENGASKEASLEITKEKLKPSGDGGRMQAFDR